MLSSKKKLWLALSTAVLAVTGLAHAGYKQDSQAIVGSWFAAGALGSIRNSSDTKQFADVTVRDNAWAWLVVVDANGKAASCTTTDPNLIATASAVSAASYIYFEFDRYGECTTLDVRNGSYHATPVL